MRLLFSAKGEKMTTKTQVADKIGDISINKVKKDAHWSWMRAGWAAFRGSWRASVKIGALVVLVSWAIILTLYKSGNSAFIPAAYGAFALVGPLIATLIYGISRELEDTSEKVRRLRDVSMRPTSPEQTGFIGFSLLVIVMVWGLLALLLYALAVGLGAPMKGEDFINFVLSTPQGLIMATIGTIIGAILALIGYSIAAISIPLVFDRDIDALSAMAASVNAVIKNPMAMLSWAFAISVIVALCAPLAFLPMIVIFPWLGHVTWQAYRELID